MAITRDVLGKIGYSTIYTLIEDRSAYFFSAGMMIDADGAYRAYHPQPGKGLDYLDNGGKLGNWWALVTDNGKPSGNPLIQGQSDPAPGYYISTTSLEDTSKKRADPTRYVDSESIPFFVLPGNAKFGASLGDFGVAVNPKTGKVCGCIHADSGPKGSIGEGSIALAQELRIASSPKDGGIAHGIVYVIFPGSKQHWPSTSDAIKTSAQSLFSAWGGIAKLKLVLPEIAWP